MFTDITHIKQSEQTLIEREQLFRSLFENQLMVMLLIDPADSRILDANPAAALFYGYPLEALRRMKVTEINQLPPDQVHRAMENAITKRSNQFSFPHRKANGEVRQVEVFSSH